MRKLILGSLLLLALAACALEPKLDQTRRESIRSAAVVSLIGDEVHLNKIGFTVFQNDNRSQRVDWKADEDAERALGTLLLSRNVRLAPAHYDAAKLSSTVYKSAAFEPFVDPKRIEPELREIANRTSADVIILVANGSYTKGPVNYEGAGLYTQGHLWKERIPISPYLALSLFIIDAKTLQVLASVTRVTEGTMYNLNPTFGLAASTPPAPFFTGFTFPMNDEQMKFLREKLQEMLPATLMDLSQRVGL